MAVTGLNIYKERFLTLRFEMTKEKSPYIPPSSAYTFAATGLFLRRG